MALASRSARAGPRGAAPAPRPAAGPASRVAARANKGSDAAAAAVGRGKEWLGTILSRFGPATDRAQNITTLEFEKPLLELDKRIKEVRARGAVVLGVMSALARARASDAPAPPPHCRSGRSPRRTASTSARRSGSSCRALSRCARARRAGRGRAAACRAAAAGGAAAPGRGPPRLPRCCWRPPRPDGAGAAANAGAAGARAGARAPPLPPPPRRQLTRRTRTRARPARGRGGGRAPAPPPSPSPPPPPAAQGDVQPAHADAAPPGRAPPQPPHLPRHHPQHHRQVCGAPRRPCGPRRPGHCVRHRLHRRRVVHVHRPAEGPQHQGARGGGRGRGFGAGGRPGAARTAGRRQGRPPSPHRTTLPRSPLTCPPTQSHPILITARRRTCAATSACPSPTATARRCASCATPTSSGCPS
jgi:hypothetical protein